MYVIKQLAPAISGDLEDNSPLYLQYRPRSTEQQKNSAALTSCGLKISVVTQITKATDRHLCAYGELQLTK